jgi:hypothetical protein
MYYTTSPRFNLVSVIKTFLIVTTLVGIPIFITHLYNKSIELEHATKNISKSYEQLEYDYMAILETEHLKSLENIKLAETKQRLEEDYQNLKSQVSSGNQEKIDSVHKLYKEVLEKLERNNKVKIDTKAVSDQVTDWGVKFLNQDYDNLQQSLALAKENLDKKHQEYLDSLPKPKPKSEPIPAPGYNYQTVSNSRGHFGVHLVKMPLSEVAIRTTAANENDCANDCPAKPLADYVKENGAYAGINGTYFCPPDYSSCNGKTNSYDFAFFNSNKGNG